MRVRFLAPVLVAAACTQTPPPACPTPAVATEPTAAVDEPEPDDELVTEHTSADGLYTCGRPHGDLVLTLRAGYTARDLVVAYLGITCANVILPVELAGRSHVAPFEGRLKAVEIEPRFRALFEELGLALVRSRGAAIIVDQAWLAPRPGLLLMTRADTGVLLTPHSSTTSPPPPIVDGDDDDGVARVSDTHYVITRAGVATAIANGPKGARILPSTKNGAPNGLKLYAIRPSAMYAKLGFNNGDTVHSINGVAVTKPEELFLDQLFTASRLELAITRRGKPMTLVIEIRD